MFRSQNYLLNQGKISPEDGEVHSDSSQSIWIPTLRKGRKYSRTCGNTIIIRYTFQMPKRNTLAVTMAAAEETADRNAG